MWHMLNMYCTTIEPTMDFLYVMSYDVCTHVWIHVCIYSVCISVFVESVMILSSIINTTPRH